MIQAGIFRAGFLLVICLIAGACDAAGQARNEAVWAVNVGGPEYAASDGTTFRAEESVVGGHVGQIEEVLGSDDGELYQTYREGDIEIAHAMADGTYDLTFHFAEPAEVAVGERTFDLQFGDQRTVDSIDVMSFRDGKIKSALTVTVPGIAVADGELKLRLVPRAGQPILSGLVVRGRPQSITRGPLVWSDEFDQPGAPYPAKWNIEEWPPRVVNDEDQAYTARPRNVRIEDGMLVIEAHKEDYGEADYTSARIQSSGKGDLLYGRVEARARLPQGMGTWAAIWMLPSDPFTYATTCEDDPDWQGSETCDAWPNSGEIDILEHVGYQMGHVHGTVHTEAYYFQRWNQRKGRILFPDVHEAFHVYALEWTPDRIDIFVDDLLYFTYVNQGTGWRAWPFDHPFHVILNLAIGGAWGRAGGPIDDSIFPQRMLVDYVRLYALPAQD